MILKQIEWIVKINWTIQRVTDKNSAIRQQLFKIPTSTGEQFDSS